MVLTTLISDVRQVLVDGACVGSTIDLRRVEHELVTVESLQQGQTLRGWEGRSDKTLEAASRLVRDCEDVISRENESWMAAWSRGEDQALPSQPLHKSERRT